MNVTDQQLKNYRNIGIAIACATGAAAGLFFIGRRIFREVAANASQNDSLTEGDPATFAKQLKMAFENDVWLGMGTDEEKIFEVFRQIPSRAMYAKVQKEYTRMYNSNLNADLEDELSSDEYNDLIVLIGSKK